MSLSKKLMSAALAATTIVSFAGVAFIPVASAQSTSDLQAQIQALLAQIQALQSQLNTPGGTSTGVSCTFSRDLTVGSNGDDVMCLQKWLNANGAQVAASGAGSPGSESMYFGGKTKAALASYQSMHGVMPAAGYFGPKTRAYVASIAVSPKPTPTPTPTPNPNPNPNPNPTPAPGTGVSVSVASDNPPAGSLISSSGSAAARVSVLAVNITAGTGSGVTVSDLKFHKVGVLADNSISNAYLVKNGKVIAQYTSIAQGVIDFAGLSLMVSAGQTSEYWLQIDPATGLNAGNTVGFAMNAATDVTAMDASSNAITATGSFPLSGNTFTITTVTNPAIATLTVTSTAIGTTVNAGTQNNIVGAWTFTATNSKVWLKSINFRVIGSASKSDLKNVKMYINGTQVGTALPMVPADGNAYFDLSAAPGTFNTGSNNLQVFADVMGSPSFTFQFEILNAYDVYAYDSQYNVPISAASNTGTQVTINQGKITVTLDTTTPTGNIAKGQNGVTLAKFDLYAAGEPVKVKFLQFHLTFTGTTTTISTSLKSIHMDDDAGGQLGSTISTPPSSNTCTDSGIAAGYNPATGSLVYTDCFGTSASPINYIIPANTTRVLSLKADIGSGALFTTITAGLDASTNTNLTGQISSQTANNGAVTGSALTLATNALTLAQNSAVGTQSFAANSTNHKVGSYAFTASSAEGVSISNLTIKTGGYGDETQNLKVMIGGTQFGSTNPSLSAGGSYSFSGTPFTVPAGQTLIVDTYADLLSNASGTMTAATTLSSCSGNGLVSYSSITCSSTAGQDVAVSGQSKITVSLSSGAPAAQQLVMGSTGNGLASFLFTETSNAENVKITDLTFRQVVDATTTVKSAIGNMSLYQGATLLGSAGSANVSGTANSAGGSAYSYAFHFNTPIIVPQSNSIELTLKGDVSPYASSGATDNTTSTFGVVAASDVTALGQTSNASSGVTASLINGNTMTFLRSKLTVTATPGTSARSQSATDDVGTINFAADANGSLKLNTVTITFAGSAPSSAQFYNSATSTLANMNSSGAPCDFVDGGSVCYVTLYDTANAVSYFGALPQTTTTASSIRFNLNGYQLGAGTTKSFNLRINSAQAGVFVAGGTQSTGHSLSAIVNANTDVTYVDAISGGSTISNIQKNTVPITVANALYTY